MPPRSLVIVGSCEDLQSQGWFDVCRMSGYDAHLLEPREISRTWWLTAESGVVPSVRTVNGRCFVLNDRSVCWSLRGPFNAPLTTLSTLSLLHRYLSWYSYPLGNYFQHGYEECRIESKPLQIQFTYSQYPTTHLATRLETVLDGNRDQYVAKSISGQRSIVVRCSDPRLKHSDNRQPFPVQLQQHVVGLPIKVHFYRTRYDTWMTFAVASESDSVDYRYSSTTTYREIVAKPLWYKMAADFYAKCGTRFFDIDIICSDGTSLTFLEVNCSPAPVYFERAMESGALKYSARVISDWLSGGLA